MIDAADALVFDARIMSPADVGGMTAAELFYWLDRASNWFDRAKRRKKRP